MGPGNRRKGPSRLWGLQAIAYTEQLKISMPKWLLDKDQVGTVVGVFVSWGWELGFQIFVGIVESSNFDSTGLEMMICPQVLDD